MESIFCQYFVNISYGILTPRSSAVYRRLLLSLRMAARTTGRRH